MRLVVLASGSSGNALVVESREGAVLVDCGLGPRVLGARLQQVGLAAERVQALLLTHEHADHSKGLPSFRKRFSVPVWATAGTWQALGGIPEQGELLRAGKPVSVAGLRFWPVPTSHDALEPVGLVVESGRFRLGILTDTGMVTELLFERLAGCHALLLETNHDVDMLRFGPYPAHLKQRIASRRGHLANEQARAALERLVHPHLQLVVAMHLSQENNSPQLVRHELGKVLAGSNVGLAVASPREPLSFSFAEAD